MKFAGPASLLLAALLVAGCAGDSGPPKPAAGMTDGSFVRGLVIDEQTLPIMGAMVALAYPSNLTRVANATTDAQGKFQAGPVGIGDWVLIIDALGFETYTRTVKVTDDGFRGELRALMKAVSVPVPFSTSFPTTIHVQYGAAYHVGGDFNQGCVEPSYTCNAVSYPSANIQLFALDPKATPLATLVLEETWTANSPVCAKSVALDLYNPDAPSTNFPTFDNAHYWTNYPNPRTTTTNPVVMIIPRAQEGNADAIDDPKRIEKNGGDRLYAKGNWTLRHFPPGKGLTNLPADANCFTDQRFFIYWSAFYLEPAPVGFTARPPS